MTANEMSERTLILADKLYQYGSPGYDDYSMGKILTDAQLNVVSRAVPRFESSERLRANLEQYLRSASITGGTISQSSSQVGVHTNGTFYDMPTDYFLAVEESCDTASKTDILVRPVKHDFYIKNRNNPYKKPTTDDGVEVFWRMDFSRETHAVGVTPASAKREEIITDGTTITDYKVRYLITPPDIVVDTVTTTNQVHSILDNTLHPEIVREAVRILTGATEPEEYQISDKEEKENRS